jgi:predicted RNase H-like HicB family nuclease
MTQTHRRTVEEYLELPYGIIVTHDHDDDGNEGFVAEVRELPGCISQGETPEEAVRNVYDAMAGWISVALDDGGEIPEPRDESKYSGRFLLRLPRGLHAELARQAEAEGVSLNQYATMMLAGATGWRREPA